MSPSTRVRALVVLAAAGTLITACGGDDDGASDSAFCVRAREIDEQYRDVDPTAEEAAAEWRSLGDVAPADLDEDVTLIAETFDKLVAAGEDPEQLEALQGQAQAVADARARIEAHLQEECEVSLSSGGEQAPETIPTVPGTTAPTATTPPTATTIAG